MPTPLEDAINSFFQRRLKTVNELHHPNDERLLYNVALEAVREGEGLHEEEFRAAFENEVKEEGINEAVAETWYPEYRRTLQRAHSILTSLHEKGIIPDDFRF